MKYEVWKSCETGGDYLEKTFTDIIEAWGYMEICERYNPGWHFRCIEVQEKGD